MAPASATEEKRFDLRAGVAPAGQHSSSLLLFTGYTADPGTCGNEMVGPLPRGEYTGKEAWLTLIASACHLVERRDATGKLRVFADMSRCKCSFGFPP
ncbi:hypothetical protein GCM10011487_12000 [Steroidobacter agaridevorans]|uniref:Uncharacterized protein n=1 Tax=Steroidobacter agaridevorans TaxID=2695856 RepID=A0A829Y7L7_9GAMM|nr:hypothetical protein GCM10011487_12000 [Steroidobacter agaridevorans]